MRVLIGSAHGVFIFEQRAGEWQETGGGLTAQPVTSVAAQDHSLLAGTTDGLFRSEDQGQTWQLAAGSTGDPHATVPASFIHPDVHAVTLRTPAADQVFAPTGGGLYYSLDGGDSWTELYDCYCRAIWVDPADPGHLVFGPAEGVGRNGRVVESIDGGATWQPAVEGLPERWPDHMVERFVQAGDELLAILSNGQLIAAPLETLAWRAVLPAIQDVNATVALGE